MLVQSDKQGQIGDVRDIVITNNLINEEIGISVKHSHNAVKHSRLSEQIDFGTDWMSIKSSESYFNTVTPIFQELRKRKALREKWRDIVDKKQKYYLPILKAFQTEIQHLFSTNSVNTAKALVHYLLGKYDFYKVIKQNGNVSAMSFNINGTLKWGRKMPMPTRIVSIGMKPNSDTTLLLIFDQGWQLSFRIHNASTWVEPSLKFDINIVGMPSNLSRHEINYHD